MLYDSTEWKYINCRTGWQAVNAVWEKLKKLVGWYSELLTCLAETSIKIVYAHYDFLNMILLKCEEPPFGIDNETHSVPFIILPKSTI